MVMVQPTALEIVPEKVTLPPGSMVWLELLKPDIVRLQGGGVQVVSGSLHEASGCHSYVVRFITDIALQELDGAGGNTIVGGDAGGYQLPGIGGPQVHDQQPLS